MRKGEILGLTWEDWKDKDLESNLITVRHIVSNSKKSRRIPISSALRKILLEQKLKTAQTDFVFVTDLGIPYSPNNPNSLKRAFGMLAKEQR